MKKRARLYVAAAIVLPACSLHNAGGVVHDNNLKVVIVRHGEKPRPGDNLSCQGENRARQLPAVLYKKFGKPDYTYVPALGLGKSTLHARMFQTVTPLAIKYDLTVNTEFGGTDFAAIAEDVLKKTGTVLMVWNHSAVRELASKLGVSMPPPWDDEDYDTIWIITFPDGKATLSIDYEGIAPSPDCGF